MVGISPATDSAFYACCPKLTFKQRVYGCVGCFLFGVLFSLMGMLSWWGGNTAAFAVMYTCGNIVSLCGSG